MHGKNGGMIFFVGRKPPTPRLGNDGRNSEARRVKLCVNRRNRARMESPFENLCRFGACLRIFRNECMQHPLEVAGQSFEVDRKFDSGPTANPEFSKPVFPLQLGVSRLDSRANILLLPAARVRVEQVHRRDGRQRGGDPVQRGGQLGACGPDERDPGYHLHAAGEEDSHVSFSKVISTRSGFSGMWTSRIAS